jgi:TolB-like protein
MAVWDFDAKNVKRVEVEILVDRLTTKIAQIGQYTVIERAKMKEVLEEQGFQQSGVCGNECVVEVGNMLGVSVMVTGSIGKLGDLYTIDARAISVETGKILDQASQDWEGKISEVLTEVIPVIAQQLSGQAVSLKIKKEPQVNYSQRKGTLYIESTPSQAKVWVDDILIDGITPLPSIPIK